MVNKILPVVFAGALAFQASAAEIKVAVAGPITGAVAQYGQMQFAGADAAEKLVKDAALSFKVVKFDDACDPKQAVAVANRIVSEKIKYVIGHLCSGSTEPAANIYNEEGIVMITPASTNPNITQKGWGRVFRTIGLDSQQGPTAAKYIVENAKPARIAIIHDKQQYGEGIATEVRKYLENKGKKPVLFEGVNAGDKDFSVLISKLKKEKVDFVYYGGYHPELGLILKQSSEAGLKVAFMGPEGVANADLNAIAGTAADNLLVTLPPAYETKAANKAMVDAVKAAKQDPSGPFVSTTFAAFQVLHQAIKAAGDDPTAVAKKLHAGKFTSAIGDVTYDDKGDLSSFEFSVFVWKSNGQKIQIK